uniref:Uncharacterized protein n=1 Tax=Kalanchoe fedtschenkoi TaxID=63787 RepID=A0A7N0TLF8_KALFE
MQYKAPPTARFRIGPCSALTFNFWLKPLLLPLPLPLPIPSFRPCLARICRVKANRTAPRNRISDQDHNGAQPQSIATSSQSYKFGRWWRIENHRSASFMNSLLGWFLEKSIRAREEKIEMK